MEKSTSPPELWGGVYFTPQTMKWSNLPSELSKTIQITPRRFLTAVLQNHGYCSKSAVKNRPGGDLNGFG